MVTRVPACLSLKAVYLPTLARPLGLSPDPLLVTGNGRPCCPDTRPIITAMFSTLVLLLIKWEVISSMVKDWRAGKEAGGNQSYRPRKPLPSLRCWPGFPDMRKRDNRAVGIEDRARAVGMFKRLAKGKGTHVFVAHKPPGNPRAVSAHEKASGKLRCRCLGADEKHPFLYTQERK